MQQRVNLLKPQMMWLCHDALFLITKLDLYMLRRPYQHHVHKIIKILKTYQKINKTHSTLCYPPNLTIKKQHIPFKVSHDKPRTHHRIAWLLPGTFRDSCPEFLIFAWTLQEIHKFHHLCLVVSFVFCLKQQKTQHGWLFFFLGGGGWDGVWKNLMKHVRWYIEWDGTRGNNLWFF